MVWPFLAVTEVPSVPIYLLADDRCHSQLNSYSEEPLSGGFSQTRTRDLFTHNRCPYRHWCPRRTKYCLLKALHSPIHPNHLRLRVSSAIVTSLQQTNRSRKSRSTIYNLHFPTKIGDPCRSILSDQRSSISIHKPTMLNPVRLLFPASIGQQKSRHESSLLLFPYSLPMSRPRASSHQAQTSRSAELPVPVPCTHFFYALNMIMAGYVGVPCSYQQTLQKRVITNNCNNWLITTKLSKSENAADVRNPESRPKHEAGRLARIVIM